MANVLIKSLADGQLASSKGEIYPCPAATQTILRSIILVNTHSSALTINLYRKVSSGSSRHIIPKDTSLAANAKMEAIDKPVYLEAGDIIEGDDGGTGSKVDYVISGVENS